ncbi:sensor histidine kinase [Mariniphaga sp.]|uniref:sensor histidine kinase n=1 Tax=Mariniphaga sp. TaxID=1954475 RepID=UPI003565083F
MTGAFFISLLFSILLAGRVFHEGLPIMILLTWLQLEIFIWLGFRFFRDLDVSVSQFKKKTIVRLVLFYLVVIIIASAFFLAVFFLQKIINGVSFTSALSAFKQQEISGFISATLIGFAFGTLFFFYSQWSDALKREEKLAQEKLLFQYETLKSQVNPHFLFNSLNTLSSLVHSNPSLSEEFIRKLSNNYRYILENQEKDLVPLTDEVQFVQEYFALQKIRDEEKIELKVELTETENVLIPPVSLQLLTENALKHNAATRKNPMVITIHNEGLDKLVVRNNLQPKSQLSNSSKTGLKNLNERCRLILKREIEINQTNTEFIVKIPAKI